MAWLIDLLRVGQEQLDSDRLEEADKSFKKALSACSTEEDRQEVLRCLLKLAGKYLRRKVQDKPATLFEYLGSLEILDRTKVMEMLARLHQQTDDRAGAEKIYTEIFELRARILGADHPDVVGALKTAALLRQMQGKSAEELYIKAYEVSKSLPVNDAAKLERQRSNRPTEEVVIQIVTPKMPAAGLDDGNQTSGAHPAVDIERAEHEPEKPPASGKEIKEKKKQTTSLHLLDELLVASAPAEKQANDEEMEPVAEFMSGPLTLKSNLQELVNEWGPFCSLITKQLVKLLQQNSNPAYRNTLTQLSALLTDSKGVRQVDLENPFLAVSRRPECNFLDWQILKELAPVYSAYVGNWNTYPFEIGMIYACLRRAFALGPLHADTLQSLYRLSHIYSHEMFGCYDLDFAAATFRICNLAFHDHPEIDDLTRIRCRTSLASVLMAKNELKEAKECLKIAIRQADSCQQMNNPELIALLKRLGECTYKLADYFTAASVYERIRNFQEAVSRDTGLFDTLVMLFSNYKKAGDDFQAATYQQRLYWELDWFEDPNPMRESIAAKAQELEQYDLAEMMLNDIISNSKPFEPQAGRAAASLIKIYELTGRHELAEKLKFTG